MGTVRASRVVVPMDFSDDSYRALDAALEIADAPSSLHIVHVLPQLSAMEPGVVFGDVTDESRRKHTEEMIRKRLKSDDRYAEAHVAVRIGNASREVTGYAGEIGADLIVLASHGHSRAHELLVGSTTARVLHHARCPVLVLRHGHLTPEYKK